MRLIETVPCKRCRGSGTVFFVLHCPECQGSRVESITIDYHADPDVGIERFLRPGRYAIKPYDGTAGGAFEADSPEATAANHIALDLMVGADANRIQALTLQRAKGMVAQHPIEWINAYVEATDREMAKHGMEPTEAVEDTTPRGVAINNVAADFLLGWKPERMRAESRKRAKEMASGVPPDWIAEYLRECDQATARLHAGMRA